MLRRNFMMRIVALPWAVLAGRQGLAAMSKTPTAADVVALQKDWKKLLAANAEVATTTAPLNLSNDEWKKRLAPAAYDVLREEGTEPPGPSPLKREKRVGVFACAGCGLPLFTSAMKFESGTGWPSFFTLIPGTLVEKTDHKMILPRTEYHCVRCGGHQGHVFDDGPAPTNLRYCNNGVALRFVPKTA
jgi:peptide-methionine (R)-S-oxide reductase